MEREVGSFLEHASVTGPVRERYEREVNEFLDYCDKHPSRPLQADDEVDEALVAYLNRLYFGGYEPAKGEQTLAGLMCMVP
eukprot:13863958-Alexandrium_andersonii.AAC.1